MLSEIGPAAGMQRHTIKPVKQLSGVGKNLNGRLFLKPVVTRKECNHHRTLYITSLDKLGAACALWDKSETGPLANIYVPQMICCM